MGRELRWELGIEFRPPAVSRRELPQELGRELAARCATVGISCAEWIPTEAFGPDPGRAHMFGGMHMCRRTAVHTGRGLDACRRRTRPYVAELHTRVAQQERSYAGGRRLSQSNRAELCAHCSASGAAGCTGRGTDYAIPGARRRSPDIPSTQSAKRRELTPHMGGPVAGKIRCGSDGLRLARRRGPARR